MADQTTSFNKTRQARMGLLAKAPQHTLLQAWHDAELQPAFEWLRAPEIGAVMVRGRAGGTGAAFNLGEMSVTRCTLKLQGGEVGHGYVQGRSKAAAEVAALVDALMQTHAADHVQDKVIQPLQIQLDATRETRAAKAAATKVEFFTVARGED